MYILSNHLSFLQISILITLSAFLVEKASATLKFTNPSFADLTAGAPFNVTWSGASGTTTLTLQNGTASGIQTVGVIAFGIQNPYILWSPYATVPSATYVLRLDDTSGQSAYSAQFTMLASGTKTSLTTGLQFTNPSLQGLTAGVAFNVTWSDANGTSTLTLQNGTSNSINTLAVISAGIKNTYLLWTPYATTPAGQYVLRLDDSSGSTAYSNMFEMIVQESDPTTTSSTLTSTSTPTSSSSSSSSTQTPTPAPASPSPSSPPSTPSSKSGLSAGAKAGIAIGAVVVGLAFIAAMVILFLRRKGNGTAPSEMPVYETMGYEGWQDDAKTKVEVEAKMIPVEISGGAERVYEMDGRRIDW